MNHSRNDNSSRDSRGGSLVKEARVTIFSCLWLIDRGRIPSFDPRLGTINPLLIHELSSKERVQVMVAENNQLRHYSYSKANADMKQQHAVASAPAPDMGSRKRNGTSDDGTSMQSYATDRYFSQQKVQSSSTTSTTSRSNEYGPLSFTNPRRTVARRLPTASVATSSVHDHFAHSIASPSSAATNDQATIGHSGHELCQNTAALTFCTGVRKTAPLPVYNHYGSRAMSNANNVAPSDHSNHSDGSPVVEAADQQHATKFSFAVLSEVECCELGPKDATRKRVGLPEGFKGLACRQCKGSRMLGGRLFPSKIKTMADTSKTLMPMYKHLMKCIYVSATTKARLEICKAEHENERKSQKKYGSQTALCTSIWERLHGKGHEK